MTEYEFIDEDGNRFYELVENRSDIHQFTKLHNAVKAAPVEREEVDGLEAGNGWGAP